MKRQKNTTRMLVLMALFIAMSVVGSYVKIPNPVTGSIACDSFAAFLAALILGGIPGAIVGFLGHMVSALLSGFPLTIPIHILVASEMAVIMFLFNFINRKINIIAAAISGIILNGLIAPAALILIPGMGIPVFLSCLVPLTAASILNVILSAVVYCSIKNTRVIKDIMEIKNEL